MPRVITIVVLGVVAVLTGCGGGDSGKPASADVSIADFKFSPAAIEVKRGGTVEWRNADRAQHTATAEEGSSFQFDTGTLRKGRARKVKFSRKGTFTYVCSFHPFMQGKVSVK